MPFDPQNQLECSPAFAPNAILVPGLHGQAKQITMLGSVSLLAYFAARAPTVPQWAFDLVDAVPLPEADVISQEEVERIQANAMAKSGDDRPPAVERVRNLKAINAANERNAILTRAQWPWVWARAVLAEIPPLPQAEANGVVRR